MLEIARRYLWQEGEERLRATGKPISFSQEMLEQKLQEVHWEILRKKEEESKCIIEGLQTKNFELEAAIGRIAGKHNVTQTSNSIE